MHAESVTAGATGRRVRFDLLAAPENGSSRRPALALIALSVAATLWGAADRDLRSVEAALGMAAGEPGLAPFGRVFGMWDAKILPGRTVLMPGRVVPSQLWTWAFGEAGLPTPAAVHVPAALASVAIGLILARRAWRAVGPRGGALTAACVLGGLGMMERPEDLGFDAITGLFVVAAIDRVVGRSSDWVAGLWSALAVLSGGWPALAVVLLPILILGRQGSYLSARLVVPPLLALVGWSAWALASAPPSIWAEALVLPLMSPAAWTFAPTAIVLALPWSPFAALIGWRTLRSNLSESGRGLVLGWLQVSGALALAGTLIPGLASPALLPTIAGLAIAAAAGLDRALAAGGSHAGVRRTLLGLSVVLALAWGVIAIPRGTFLAAAVPYYRFPTIVIVAAAIVTLAFAVVGAWERRLRWAVGVALAVALGIKCAHATVIVPEWNYRLGQGPWGRAIGHWVPGRWPIYVFHPWPTDLAFATEHPFFLLGSPRLLAYQVKDRPVFVLLRPADFEHWPEEAPKLQKIREFEDWRGDVRVLARTEGPLITRVEEDEEAGARTR
jgi:hypothetical protein